MKKILLAIVVIVAMSSCNKITRIGDSEISAIRDQTDAIKEQTEVMKEQNKILTEIKDKIK